LRALGQKCLAKHTELEKAALLDCMARVRLAPLGEEDARTGATGGINCDEGAVRTMSHLEQLRGQWQNVLPDSVYERVMGYLVECVLRCAVAPVQEADVIAATAATDIGRIFRSLSKCKDVLLDAQPDNVQRMVPSYNKFVVLTDLLDFSISDVMEWLPRKKFASFTSAELSALIKALFDDSERRQNILNLILDMGK
jgi:protein transport protein DSL1/ZW10